MGARTIVAALVSGPILGGGIVLVGVASQFGFGTEPARVLRGLRRADPPGPQSAPHDRCSSASPAASSTIPRSSGGAGRAAGSRSRRSLWAGAGFLVFYTADWIEAGLQRGDAGSSRSITRRRRPCWPCWCRCLSSLAGLAARGSGGERQHASKLGVMQTVALPLVIFLLLSSVAWADLRLMARLEYQHARRRTPRARPTVRRPPSAGASIRVTRAGAGLGEVLMLFGSLLTFGLVMSRTGARQPVLAARHVPAAADSHVPRRVAPRSPARTRSPDSMRKDDLRVHDLADVRPLHVINTTLNAVESTHVGRHETKAQSFTFSPLHVGNRFVGYRPADAVRIGRRGPGTGISLGMALAVSGAAASSGDGHVLVEGARVPADARQRAARPVVRQSAEREDVAAQRAAARRRAARARDARPDDGSQSVRLSVRRRPLRESRAVGDGRAALPLHHHLGRRLRSGLCVRPTSPTPCAASASTSASRFCSRR